MRVLLGLAATLLATLVLAAVFIAVFGWNWLRAPLERMVLQKTGRELAIHGDLTVKFGWPQVRVRGATLTFANPAWTQERYMVAATSVEVAVDVPQLLQRHLTFPEVRLQQATVFLETSADGRKNWLLDLAQQDENARIRIGRIALDRAQLGYDDVARKTRLRATLSTGADGAEHRATADLQVTANGRYKGLEVKAQGSGGPVLALRDTTHPYPLKAQVSLGRTEATLEGTVTGLLGLDAVDLRMALHGDSLEQLYPLLGIAFPATRAYRTAGHLLHAGSTWRYEQFTGRVGASDLAGFVQVVTGGQRPALTAALTSRVLVLDDLGPVIGARPGRAAQAAALPVGQARVLPDLPFKTDRWDSVDAEVDWHARSLRHAKALPLENLVVHLSLRDAVLTLDPLNFGLAGGQLDTRITLDGRSQPNQAHARVRARKVLLSRLFPTVDLNKNSIGQVNGQFDLTGKGHSVGSMLASANGKLGLVVAGGEVSKLMMEKIGLHLWEILSLNVTGDRLVKLRCAVADFDVKQGRMTAGALVFDTQVTTLIGTGTIDLGDETLDLTLIPKTKKTSPLALTSPIYLRGSFAQPTAAVDKGRVALRALGAVGLGLINPLLALIPLIDAGPGEDSDCGQLVREARALPHAAEPPGKVLKK